MSLDQLFQGLPSEKSADFVELCAFCSMHRANVLASLPWLAADIAGLDGFPLMFKFVTNFSGARLHVSTDPKKFKKTVGIDISDRTHRRILLGAGSSQIIDVPSAWGIFISLRRVAIQSMIQGGAEPREVARRFGVSERSLRSRTAPS